MPRNASKRLNPLFYTVLLARFRAAKKALRIPKVFGKRAKSRIEHCVENTAFLVLFSVLAGYPCQEP